MARKLKKASAPAPVAVPVVDSTEMQEEERRLSTAPSQQDTVCIACSLPFELTFKDVPTRSGGVKSVTFPGVNDSLRGKPTGILADAGKSVCVRIAAEDWANIKRIHGRERVFTAEPPKLWEFDSVASYRAARDEVAEMSTGVEPVNPARSGVTAAR